MNLNDFNQPLVSAYFFILLAFHFWLLRDLIDAIISSFKVSVFFFRMAADDSLCVNLDLHYQLFPVKLFCLCQRFYFSLFSLSINSLIQYLKFETLRNSAN